MTIILLACACVLGIYSLGALFVAATPLLVHRACLLLLSSAVLLAGGGICDYLRLLVRKRERSAW